MRATPSDHGQRGRSLADLAPGHRGVIVGLRTNGLLYRRLLDLGMVVGSDIEARYASPSGDPVVFRTRGADIALRKADAALVDILPVDSESESLATPASESVGCAHCFQSNHCTAAAPVKGEFLVALAGNPNTGKSTVFNALTGLRQHVGNWAGKTVMRAEGQWSYGGAQFRLVDLPGTYSLLSTSVEEEIARDFILFAAPDCTVVVADATCLERNLNLVVQILQITNRVVVCVNLLDEASRRGIRVDLEVLSERLGVPVVGTAARSGRGLDALQETIRAVASGEVVPEPVRLRYDDALEQAVETLAPEIEATLPGVPNARWIALRLIDGGDTRLLEEIQSGLLSSPSGRFGADSLPSHVAASGAR